VNPTTLSRLLDINRQFYQAFAAQFSLTRQRLQPGVTRILEQLDISANVLDLGCGNGELARQLARRGHTGIYTGLDFSPALLEQASAGQPSNFHFLQVDLSRPDWDASLQPGQSDLILAFAMLHHLPGVELRQRVLHQIMGLLSPNGQFIHSEWQFLNSPRLKARIQPWETIGLAESDLDPGDYLLDWRQGGVGLRYVHHFSETELMQLAEAAGFEVTQSFLSDGKNSRLGLYQVWQAK
jgi:tRNA (uracil-5-)-methyltransferase TRM9